MHGHTTCTVCGLTSLLFLLACDGSSSGTPAPEGTPAVETALQDPPPVPPSAVDQAMPAGGVGTASNGALQVVPGRFELGDIAPGSSHERTFRFRNITSGPIKILRSVASCKCTATTDVTNRVLAPGESIDFLAELSAPRTPGLKEAKVQIIVDGGLPPLTLQVIGDVAMPIKAAPTYVGGPKGDTMRGTVRLESKDVPFNIISAGGAPADHVSPTESSSKVHDLYWNLEDGFDLDSRIWWVVYTDHPECPVLPLRIRNPLTGSRADMARYDRHWMFDENVVNAGRIRAGEPVEFDVVIAHYNPRGRGQVVKPTWRNVLSVTSATPGVDSRMVAVTPISRDEIRIRFSITPDPGTSGPLYAFVDVETDTGTGRFAVLALVD